MAMGYISSSYLDVRTIEDISLPGMGNFSCRPVVILTYGGNPFSLV